MVGFTTGLPGAAPHVGDGGLSQVGRTPEGVSVSDIE